LEYDIDTNLGIQGVVGIVASRGKHEPDQTSNLRDSVSPEPVVSRTLLLLDASTLEFSIFVG
jgi:hypothetical protein